MSSNANKKENGENKAKHKRGWPEALKNANRCRRERNANNGNEKSTKGKDTLSMLISKRLQITKSSDECD